MIAGGLAAVGAISVTVGAGAAATAATVTTVETTVMADGDPTNEVNAVLDTANAACGGDYCASETESLFRAVSQSEADDILANHLFRPKPGGMEGKFFWKTLESAQNYLPTYSAYARIVEIKITKAAVNAAVQAGGFFENLDGFGDAVYFERGLIQMLNDNIIDIIVK